MNPPGDADFSANSITDGLLSLMTSEAERKIGTIAAIEWALEIGASHSQRLAFQAGESAA